jgi:hypothetical protein
VRGGVLRCRTWPGTLNLSPTGSTAFSMAATSAPVVRPVLEAHKGKRLQPGAGTGSVRGPISVHWFPTDRTSSPASRFADFVGEGWPLRALAEAVEGKGKNVEAH